MRATMPCSHTPINASCVAVSTAALPAGRALWSTTVKVTPLPRSRISSSSNSIRQKRRAIPLELAYRLRTVEGHQPRHPHGVRRVELHQRVDVAAAGGIKQLARQRHQVGARDSSSRLPVPRRGVRRQHGPRRCRARTSLARSWPGPTHRQMRSASYLHPARCCQLDDRLRRSRAKATPLPRLRISSASISNSS